MPQEFVPVHWDPAPKRILCDLPLTRPTGRVRLRRGEKPIPARQVPLHAEDVIEWQIAYRDHQGNRDVANHPSGASARLIDHAEIGPSDQILQRVLR